MSQENPMAVTGERVFVLHLRNLVGRTVTISVMDGALTGTLAQVFPDHVLLMTPEGQAHIRIEAMNYVMA